MLAKVSFLVPKPIDINASVASIVSPVNVTQANDVVSAQVEAILSSKMQNQKDKILAALAKCESESVDEPEAALVWDSNQKHAIGKYQWQIKSVQRYVQKWYGQKIDRKTAILIALNAYPEIPVDELTRKVVFEDAGIAKDWVNCSNKYGLPAKVELIKELTN